MSAMTIPVPVILLSLTGLARAFREWIRRRADRFQLIRRPLPVRGNDTILFVFLNFLFPFLIIAAPNTPIFGGTKHWMPGVAFLAIFAGLGFETVLDAIRGLGERFAAFNRRTVRFAAALACLAVIMIPAARDTFHGHTNGSTYYNAAFGGSGQWGAWGCNANSGATPLFGPAVVNENARKNAQIDFHDTAWDSVRMYWRDGCSAVISSHCGTASVPTISFPLAQGIPGS